MSSSIVESPTIPDSVFVEALGNRRTTVDVSYCDPSADV